MQVCLSKCKPSFEWFSISWLISIYILYIPSRFVHSLETTIALLSVLSCINQWQSILTPELFAPSVMQMWSVLESSGRKGCINKWKNKLSTFHPGEKKIGCIWSGISQHCVCCASIPLSLLRSLCWPVTQWSVAWRAKKWLPRRLSGTWIHSLTQEEIWVSVSLLLFRIHLVDVEA